MSDAVHVAVGVIINKKNQVLIALRDAHQHQGGLWEFPGGKVEPGESVSAALARELFEEVNLKVTTCIPLLTIPHDYGDKQVVLEVLLVKSFSGEAVGKEGQSIKWSEIMALDPVDFPAANGVIINAIKTLGSR